MEMLACQAKWLRWLLGNWFGWCLGECLGGLASLSMAPLVGKCVDRCAGESGACLLTRLPSPSVGILVIQNLRCSGLYAGLRWFNSTCPWTLTRSGAAYPAKLPQEAHATRTAAKGPDVTFPQHQEGVESELLD